MTIEDGVAVLFQLRREGFVVRRSPTGNVQISPAGRMTEEIRETVRRNKPVVLDALEMETPPGAGKAEENARELLAQGSEPWAVGMETEGEWTFVVCLRRDNSGWTIRIPREEFDPFRLAEALIRVDPKGALN